MSHWFLLLQNFVWRFRQHRVKDRFEGTTFHCWFHHVNDFKFLIKQKFIFQHLILQQLSFSIFLSAFHGSYKSNLRDDSQKLKTKLKATFQISKSILKPSSFPICETYFSRSAMTLFNNFFILFHYRRSLISKFCFQAVMLQNFTYKFVVWNLERILLFD